MPIENTTNHQNKDFLVENAIKHGTQKIEEENEKELYINLRYTNSELEKIKELTSVLRLSKELFIETAISYLYFRFSENQDSIKKIISEETEKYKSEFQEISIAGNKSRREIDRLYGKIKLSPEISHKVEQLNMKDNINECLFTGINLLYKQLIGDFKIVNQQK
ncbi:hypothetical protein IQ231_00345 [Cuspidothrix issatschenkoi LEGE 03284]|jgi:hypothetical protein|uniref:Uncharacterized protein n=1 Tax=Cuspidothrix issatschenkoi CHARLIE-1 TaxID=2052836 RepID=A0A2S6CSE4_9CYAN|nr:hypothetical protein [Cuspidothrix issatschenkoi]MBE9230184.1 hypothetical protein [Cuspidothrix issatschenkoi LEGE 03284]PPJ62666.1 hypothetical protein CUN59_14340 [Cuspidothrix issatschenkoi CHARLIE-1]